MMHDSRGKTEYCDARLEEQSQNFTDELIHLDNVLEGIVKSCLSQEIKSNSSTPSLDKLQHLLATSRVFGKLSFSDLLSPTRNYFFRQQALIIFRNYHAFLSRQLNKDDLIVFSEQQGRNAGIFNLILVKLEKLSNIMLLFNIEKNNHSPVLSSLNSHTDSDENLYYNENSTTKSSSHAVEDSDIYARAIYFGVDKSAENSLTEMRVHYKLFLDKANEFMDILRLRRRLYPYKQKWRSLCDSLTDFLSLPSISPFAVWKEGKIDSLKLKEIAQSQAQPLQKEIREKLSSILGISQQLTELRKEAQQTEEFFSQIPPLAPPILDFKKITQRSELLDRKQTHFLEEESIKVHPLTEQITKLLTDNPRIPEDLHQLLLDFLDYSKQTGEFQPVADAPIDRQQNQQFLLFMSKCCRVCNVAEKSGPDTIENDRLSYFYFLRVTIQQQLSAIQAKYSRSNDEQLKTRLQQSWTVLSFLYHSLFFDPVPLEKIVIACDDLIKACSESCSPPDLLPSLKALLDQCFTAQLTLRQGKDFSSIDTILANKVSIEKQISANVQAMVEVGENLEAAECLKSRVLHSISFLFAGIRSLAASHSSLAIRSFEQPKSTSPFFNLFARVQSLMSRPAVIDDSPDIDDMKQPSSKFTFFDNKERSPLHTLPNELKQILMTPLDIFKGETDRDTLVAKGNLFLDLCVKAQLITLRRNSQLKKLLLGSLVNSRHELKVLQSEVIKNLDRLFEENPTYEERYKNILNRKMDGFMGDYIRKVKIYAGRSQPRDAKRLHRH